MARIRTVLVEETTQSIDRGRTGRFHKEILLAPLGRERGSLALLRKKPLKPAAPRGAVVLFHGFGQNRYSWHLSSRSLANYLASRGFDVFNAELRGHGRSRGAGSTYPSHFDDYIESDATTAVEAACEISGFEKAFVIGHSLGGAVSYALAGHTARRVAGIISMAGVYQFGQGQPIFKHLSRAFRLGRGFADPVLSSLPYVPVDLAGKLLLSASPLLDHPRFGSNPLAVWYPATIEPEVLRERLSKGMDRTGTAVLRQMIEWAATGRFVGDRSKRDFDKGFSRTDLPLLVLSADMDKLCTPSDCMAGYDASRSADKTYREFGLQEGGHWGHIDLICGMRAPVYVWPVVGDWLEERAKDVSKT